MIQGKLLTPYRHCTWDPKRYVSIERGKARVPAIIEIDKVVGNALFDLDRNRYLTPHEEDDARDYEQRHGSLPNGILEREQRIHGWIGVQRYSDPNDFGIDSYATGAKFCAATRRFSPMRILILAR